MAKRRSRKERRAAQGGAGQGGQVPYLGRIPLPPRAEQVITPKPKRSDRAVEKRRLRRVTRDPESF